MLILAALLIFPSDGYTLGQTQCVETNGNVENFGIVRARRAADLYVNELLDYLRFRNLPLLLVDVGPKAPRVSNICVDYVHGIRQAVQHIAAMKHERIGFVSGPLKLRSAVARRDAFENSMREIGLQVRPEFIVQGDHRLEGGKLSIAKIVRSWPTAYRIALLE